MLRLKRYLIALVLAVVLPTTAQAAAGDPRRAIDSSLLRINTIRITDNVVISHGYGFLVGDEGDAVFGVDTLKPYLLAPDNLKLVYVHVQSGKYGRLQDVKGHLQEDFVTAKIDRFDGVGEGISLDDYSPEPKERVFGMGINSVGNLVPAGSDFETAFNAPGGFSSVVNAWRPLAYGSPVVSKGGDLIGMSIRAKPDGSYVLISSKHIRRVLPLMKVGCDFYCGVDLESLPLKRYRRLDAISALQDSDIRKIGYRLLASPEVALKMDCSPVKAQSHDASTALFDYAYSCLARKPIGQHALSDRDVTIKTQSTPIKGKILRQEISLVLESPIDPASLGLIQQAIHESYDLYSSTYRPYGCNEGQVRINSELWALRSCISDSAKFEGLSTYTITLAPSTGTGNGILIEAKSITQSEYSHLIQHVYDSLAQVSREPKTSH